MNVVFRLRQLAYDLRESLLFRPALIIAVYGLVALALPVFEASTSPGRAIAAAVVHTFPIEPANAQIVLATLAGALMTVVSVVYSTLIVALSLASIQFSTRILATFVRDLPAQATLGALIGTFVFALLSLRSVHVDPPYVPILTVYATLGLALGALAVLVWFIHHIVRNIQANHLVDRLAAEAEPVLDAVFGAPLAPGESPAPAACPSRPSGAIPVLATRSGYVQLISIDGLLDVADGGHLVLERGMGQFVVEGAPIAWWAGPRPIRAEDLAACIDVGAHRTLQDDAEWGLRQIVDIGLKAISPAVNDPSTGATCVDHVGRLCVRVANRQTPIGLHRRGATIVEHPTPAFVDLVALGFDQLRQYGRADMAITLRILRVLADVAAATPHAVGRAALLRQGQLAHEGASANFVAGDREALDARWAVLQERCRG